MFGLFLSKESRLRKKLLRAIMSGDINKVEGALADGSDVNSIYKPYSISALQIAITEQQFQIGLFLIKKGANIRYKDDMGRTTLFGAACSKQNYKIDGYENLLQKLIKHGVEINAREYTSKESALAIALFNCNIRLMNDLINNGANDSRDSMYSLVQVLILINPQKEYIKVVNYLLTIKPSINESYFNEY